jgi:biotin synthase
MPLVTPGKLRADYALYDDKPCADEETDECRACLEGRVSHTKRAIGYNQWGDSLVPLIPDLAVPSQRD